MADDAELLRAYLAERDLPCPKCGYNLRGCVAQACPECGVGLRLHVHPVIKLPASYMAGVVGLAAGIVLGVLAALTAVEKSRAAVVVIPLPVIALVQLVVWDRFFFRLRRRRSEAMGLYVTSAWIVAAVSAMAVASYVSGIWW